MSIQVAVLTVSDSVVAGTREDRSGPSVAEFCRSRGWHVIRTAAVEDDRDRIANLLLAWAGDESVNLILTTGGTGIAPRDVTPEATLTVIERQLPGIAETMRADGRKKTPLAVLSRAIAGVRGRTMILNLPGSTKGAIESLESVADLIPHVLDLIAGRTAHPEN